MYFGACYYPEHWPEERWETDARLMKEAGLNAIRMAEFAWAKMEPQEGNYQFDWLKRAIRLFEGHGIQVMLGTPTAGPPKWLLDKHPDIYQKDKYGRIKGFGARRNYCFNSSVYYTYTEKIVTQMAQTFRHDPNVFSWQIDNEFGMIDTTRCYCEDCKRAFQRWLKTKYVTIDAVNEAWGTIFSSQTFTDWEQIHLPHYAVHQNHNVGLELDYKRFASDSVKDYQKFQADLLRKLCPDHQITSNEMGVFNETNYYQLAEDLDICGLDIYPNMRNADDRTSHTALQHDLTRGFKQQNYWVLEHQSGTPGGHVLAPTPRPGELRKWTYQSISHGADGIFYFRWRTLTYAIEEYWHGILQHHGEPGRKYDEVKQIGMEWAKLAPLLRHTKPVAKVAIVRCFDNEWAFEIQPHKDGYTYIEHLLAYYKYFHHRGIQVDVIAPTADFSSYELVILPHLMMADEPAITQLKRYVQEGGHALLDFRAGAKKSNNQMEESKLPGIYRDLLGIEIEDYGILNAEIINKLRTHHEKNEFLARHWYDVIEIKGAEVLAEFTQDYIQGQPAVTCNKYGQGLAYYFGTEPDEQGMEHFLERICKKAGLKPLLPDLPEGMEASARSKIDEDGKPLTLLFLINHTSHEQSLTLTENFHDVFYDMDISGCISLEAYGVAVLSLRG